MRFLIAPFWDVNVSLVLYLKNINSSILEGKALVSTGAFLLS